MSRVMRSKEWRRLNNRNFHKANILKIEIPQEYSPYFVMHISKNIMQSCWDAKGREKTSSNKIQNTKTLTLSFEGWSILIKKNLVRHFVIREYKK